VSKRVTAKEIAEELGISMMTVSRALNNRPNVKEETRKKVIETAARMGYSPNHVARSLVKQKTETLGVVVPKITHSFFPEVIRGIEEISYSSGYHLILTHSAEDFEQEKDALQTLESKRVDGILISTAQTVEDYDIYERLAKLGVPMVFFDRCVFNIGVSCVTVDDERGARRMTRHLIEHGYQRIAHISGPSRVSIGRYRLSGYRKELEEHGLPYDESLVVEAGFQEEDGYEAMKRLLALPDTRRPDAVFAVNDASAFGAIKAIKEANFRIPDDIAIGGFTDDIRAELLEVPLTTIRQPAYEIGKKAAQQVIELIEGKSNTVNEIIVQTELVIRRSCGCDVESQSPLLSESSAVGAK